MYEHTCLTPECGTKYKSDDPDPYHCEHHIEERKRVAAEVDTKIAARGPREPEMSDLQIFDASPKVKGFVVTKL